MKNYSSLKNSLDDEEKDDFEGAVDADTIDEDIQTVDAHADKLEVQH